MLRKSIYLTTMLWLGFAVAIAQPITIKSVNIIASNTIPSPVKETTVKMLTEEIQKRTSIVLKSISTPPKSNEYTIALVLSSDKDLAGKAIPASTDKTEPEFKAE